MKFADIPQALRVDIATRISEHAIAFTRYVRHRPDRRIELVGSGTLVRIGNRHAVLTAAHVVEDLPREGRIGVLYQPSFQHSSIDRTALTVVKLPRGDDPAIGPDLAAVLIHEPVAASIRAARRFFDLAAYRESMLTSPEPDHLTPWATNGFFEESIKSRRIPEAIVTEFHNTTLLGLIDRRPDVAGFDYFEIPVSLTNRTNVPDKLNGLSGGGLWQVPLIGKGDEIRIKEPPKLSGVVFYQLPHTSTDFRVRCHGRNSVYLHAYDAIARA